jgi:ribosome-associated protein
LTEEREALKETVLAAAAAAAEKKAFDILVLQMSGVLEITDYFMICSGKGDKQTRAIADEVREKLRDQGRKPLRAAGEDTGDWVLLDYGDFVIHIFTEEMREYYQLERLWRDAPRLDLGDIPGEIDAAN